MRKKTILSLALAFATLLHGGVPVRWTAETSRVQPVSLDAFRGDTLDLECTLMSYGQPVSLGAATASLMWQTNGMGSAWWQTNATVSAGGVVRATWSPSMDPGAATVAFFLPVQTADGASYRAAGAIRFRPSPGADSQIVALPQPGGTLDFVSYQLVNAPWATLEAANAAIEAAVTSATGAIVIPPAVDLGPYATTGYVAGAITSATGAIVIPPPVDLEPYATTGQVAEAVETASSSLAAQVNAVSNAAMQRAEMGGYATVQQVADAIAGISIPSLDGYATQDWVSDYVASNTTPVDLSSYASRSYADAAASNAQATAIAAIPSLAGYATENWVEDYVASNTVPVDLSSYASRSYADAVASNAQATAIAAIPSLAGYATQSYVADYFATNYTPPDLSSYASRSYADAAASNAQATAIAAIPSLDGYPTQQQMVDYVDDRMAQGVTVQVSTTRLETPDGLIWQDATGVVWQAEAIIGWYGEIWTNNAAYSPTATGVTQAVTFAPAGPNAWTNGVFGTITNVYFDGGAMMAWYTPAGVQHADNISPLDSTNLTFNLLYPENWDALGTNVYASLSLLRGPIGISATNAIRQVAYTDGVTADLSAATNYTDAATNALAAVVDGKVSATNESRTAYVGWDGDIFRFSYGIRVDAAPIMLPSYLGGVYFGEQTLLDILDERSLAATNYTDASISTNNAAFVAAVLAAPIVGASPSDLADIAEYGSYGTVGAAILALIAGLAALKRDKANKTDLPYPFVGATVTQDGPWSFSDDNAAYEVSETESGGTWSYVLSENGAPVDTQSFASRQTSVEFSFIPSGEAVPVTLVATRTGLLTIPPRTVATYTADSSAASFTVAVGAGVTGAARDCVLVVDCTDEDAVAPTVTWPSNFHPRGDAEEIAPVAGVRNVFYISEYATGEFVVGGWHEEVA